MLDTLEALLWLFEVPRWVAETRTGKLAAVAVYVGLVLWLGFGLDAWFAIVPMIGFGVPFLIWEHRTTKAEQRKRDAVGSRASV
jgi:hypothetical protein